ncbi:MAG: hypothetical protein QOE98_833, partial [Gaiellaceae bacterium]|nr:hypothetical protein [Gaiellaceae bacterium]
AGFRADRFDGELSPDETRRRALAAYEAMYRDDVSLDEVRRLGL